uniref:beta-N-acetylhexosaminidase n=1 Tax=Panagrolaimus superbus TaxID=310955 RepID=A0A914ZBE7_9BILA
MKDKSEMDELYIYYLRIKRILPSGLPFRRSRHLRYFFILLICLFIYLIYPTPQIVSDLTVEQRIIHFDLKGAPPKFEYFRELFPFIKALGFNAILMEYEDMFPYTGELEIFRAPNAYSPKILGDILKLAAENGLEVIPLIQTFGHLQFVLKHSKYQHLREIPDKTDTICPSEPKSIELIQEMLRQIHTAHPTSKSIHIGCDEAWSIAKDERCQNKLHTIFGGASLERLKLSHILTIAKFAKDILGYKSILAWDDLLRRIPTNLLTEFHLGEYIIPVIWNYDVDVRSSNKFPSGMFPRYTKIFPKIIFGSVFKGAENGNTTFVKIDRYLSNLKSFFNLYEEKKDQLEGRIAGIAVTGWQRFWHGIELCEILPAGIPSLVNEAIYINNPDLRKEGISKKVFEFLKCKIRDSKPLKFNDKSYIPRTEEIYANCDFPGVDIYALVCFR